MPSSVTATTGQTETSRSTVQAFFECLRLDLDDESSAQLCSKKRGGGESSVVSPNRLRSMSPELTGCVQWPGRRVLQGDCGRHADVNPSIGVAATPDTEHSRGQWHPPQLSSETRRSHKSAGHQAGSDPPATAAANGSSATATSDGYCRLGPTLGNEPRGAWLLAATRGRVECGNSSGVGSGGRTTS